VVAIAAAIHVLLPAVATPVKAETAAASSVTVEKALVDAKTLAIAAPRRAAADVEFSIVFSADPTVVAVATAAVTTVVTPAVATMVAAERAAELIASQLASHLVAARTVADAV